MIQGTVSELAAALRNRYVLERELGHGGMATVYLARDLKHKRPVALKVLRPELAATLGPDRFRREIETAAGLQHPHICSVYDSGETAGWLWFTMPYVRGESLRERLRREGRLPVEQALRITTEAGRALDFAHREGFVHRDVKPENLLLTTEGDTLVADFGIVRALAGAASEGQQHLTETGIAIGTAAYMAPEQATGERTVDARADQYALAVTCYEMLAGQPPFNGPTAAAIIAERFRGPPPKVRAGRPEVPEALDRVLQRALSLNPDERFSSMSDLVRALNQGAGTGGTTAVRLPTIGQGRRARLVVGSLLIAALLVAGTFVLGRRGTSPAGEIKRSLNVTRLAVLPFENRGAAEDAYFADGVADEVRGKLAGLAGFQITARTSSDQYRKTTKSPQEIGRELGVNYLLSATLRWAKGAGGTSRVEVLPELIDVHTGAISWQQTYDADLTDIFQVQTEIASRVAGALGVALGSREQRQLAERPTTNLDAYDLYLKAMGISGGVRPATSRQRIALLEQVVALDSTFANAWASLSSSLSGLYSNSAPDPAVAMRSLAAAERAVRLDPEGPSGHRALAEYHFAVTRDAARAEEQIVLGLRNSPNDPRLLRTAANIERQIGRYDEALAHLRQAQRIDPRSVGVLNVLQVTLLWLHRYPEALAASNAALALAPGDLSLTQDKSMVYLAQGNLVGARDLVAGLSPTVPDSEVAAYFAEYWDLYWVLEDAQQRRILRLTPASFDNDRSAWASALMQLYWLRGDKSRARAYADTAYKASVLQMREAPDDAQRKVLAGLQLAYLGRKEEAIAMGLRGTALAPLARDKYNGPYYQHQLARIYLMVGEPERALDALAPLLKIPYYLSPGWLRIDPTFASLRGNHRYDQMVEGS